MTMYKPTGPTRLSKCCLATLLNPLGGPSTNTRARKGGLRPGEGHRACQPDGGRQHRLGALLRHLATLAAALLTSASQAGPLSDPTRPPAATSLSSTAANAGAQRALPAGAAAGPDSAATPLAALPPPLLQSLHLPSKGQAGAMIDGQLVKAGDLLGKRSVMAIDSQGLVLADGAGSQRLWLLAGNTKQAPGSITTSHVAAYLPASRDPDALPESDAGSRKTAVGSHSTPPADLGLGLLSLVGKARP